MRRAAFVGRDEQLTELGRLLDSARDGAGVVVLLDGEPGVGKTALANEVVRRARASEWTTAWGGCLEGEGAPPYWPWIQILRDLGAPADTLVTPRSSDDVSSRFRLFDEVIDVLRQASGSGLLIVLDDLHWADTASVRLLQVLAGEIGKRQICVLGLYRGRGGSARSDPVDAISAVARERSAHRITLGGLGGHEIAQLAVEVLERQPDRALVRAVEQRCEGNPLFALELLRLSHDPAGVGRALPAGIREAIERRLDRVSPPARRILCEAAVLGREFDAGRVAEIGERPVSTVLDLLDEAVARDLVTGDGGRRFRFAHVLTQEVAYAELTATDRYRLHARTAAVIGADEFAVDSLAHHLRQCADLGSVRPALDATLRAADQARNQLAYEHAAFQFGQALELLPLVTDPPLSRQELLLEMARCEFRSGTVADAWRSCRQAADLGRAAGDGRTVADAATVIRGITMAHADPLCEQIHALCRSALTLLGDKDPVREAKVLAQLAITANVFAGDGTARHGLRALRLAEVTAEADARFMALQARQVELVNPRYVLERLAIGERAVQLGEETGRDEYLAWGHVWRIDAFWELGRRSQLDQEAAKYTNLVGEMKEPLGMWRLRMIQACLAEMAGRFDEARELADEALVIGRRGGHQGADFIHLVVRSRIARLTGTGAEEAETAVRRFAEGGPRLARGWHAVQLIAAGRRSEAAEALDAVAPHIASVPPNAPEWLAARTGIASAGAELGVRDTAAQVYADLLPFADRMIVAGAHTGTEGPVAYYLGRLAHLLGEHGPAVTHLMSSLDSCVVMGSPPYEAMTRAELGRVLLSRRGTGDLAVAERELGTALDVARRLGMRPLETELSELLAPGRGGRVSALSAREQELADLVAEGLSNRQIAGQLYLSERTVETHVRNILGKLGFERRAQVVSWVTRRTDRR